VKPLIIEEEAERELAGSVAFYEQRQPGLGLDFERAMREALKKIANAPDQWPAGKHGTRHYLIERFPFIIHYLGHAGQNLDCCLRAHQSKTKLLEDENPVGRLRSETSSFEFRSLRFKAARTGVTRPTCAESSAVIITASQVFLQPDM
jgi:hypothetical protein